MARPRAGPRRFTIQGPGHALVCASAAADRGSSQPAPATEVPYEDGRINLSTARYRQDWNLHGRVPLPCAPPETVGAFNAGRGHLTRGAPRSSMTPVMRVVTLVGTLRRQHAPKAVPARVDRNLSPAPPRRHQAMGTWPRRSWGGSSEAKSTTLEGGWGKPFAVSSAGS